MDIEEFKIAKLELGEGDIVVLRTRDRLSRDHVEHIHEMLRRAFRPDQKCVVLDGGMEIAVLTRAEIEARAK